MDLSVRGSFVVVASLLGLLTTTIGIIVSLVCLWQNKLHGCRFHGGWWILYLSSFLMQESFGSLISHSLWACVTLWGCSLWEGGEQRSDNLQWGMFFPFFFFLALFSHVLLLLLLIDPFCLPAHGESCSGLGRQQQSIFWDSLMNPVSGLCRWQMN